jgi:hypothetical protein
MPYNSPEAALIKSQGGFGSIFVTGSGIFTGNYCMIQAMDDCKFGTLESSNMENSSAFVSLNKTLYAGMVLSADFTGINITSGTAILYKH